jgi:RNA polymerase sigma-70 factor (sigma-E family)
VAGFEEFVHTRSGALLRTAVLLTGDRGHAEDLLQTALERLARHWKRVDDPDLYVRRTLVNLATDRWRRRARRVQEVHNTGWDWLSPGDPVLAVEQRHDLIAALQQLPARQRTVLVLRFFDDLTEAQVAQALEISVGTVKSTSSKALAKLRAQFTAPEPATPRSPR